MSNVQFQEEAQPAYTIYSKPKLGILGLAMRLGAKSEKQANMILLGVTALFILASIGVILYGKSINSSRVVSAQEIQQQ